MRLLANSSSRGSRTHNDNTIKVYSFLWRNIDQKKKKRKKGSFSISGVNVGRVASLVDSAVLLSWYGSLLTSLPRFRDAIAKLTT